MEYEFRKFNPNTDTIKPFDCKESDLNGFLLEKDSSIPNATNHGRELLAVTYLLEDVAGNSTVAYFSLLNDKIERDFADPSIWNRLSREIPNAKRRKSYPAIKIGRLAVDKRYQGRGIGKQIIDFIKGGEFSETVLMFFDLKRFLL